jgi:hypothetical protein
MTQQSELEQSIVQLSHKELLETILHAVRNHVEVRTVIKLHLKEKERISRIQHIPLNEDKWKAAQHVYEREIPILLTECSALIYENESTRNGRSYYNDYDYQWDIDDGLKRLESWIEQLKLLIRQGNPISGLVGLLLTLQQLDEWSDEYEDENENNELKDACEQLWEHYNEMIDDMKTSQLFSNGERLGLFNEAIDWMLQQCHDEDVLLSWLEPLSVVVMDVKHHMHLKRQFIGLYPDWFTERAPLDSMQLKWQLWWINLSLQLDQEEEALRIMGMLEPLNLSAADSFIRFYESNQQWQQAIHWLKEALPVTSQYNQNQYYGQIVRAYERSDDKASANDWRVQQFELFPSFDLFKHCLESIEDLEQRKRQGRAWIDEIKQRNRQSDLVINMLVYWGEPDEAWTVFLGAHYSREWLPSSVITLFNTMKKHNPDQVIAVYRDYAEKDIQLKKRKSYQNAAQWLTKLKEVYIYASREQEWRSYMEGIQTNYGRLPALIDELKKARLA